MKIQVLVATMNQYDYSLLEKMNIQTDAIVGNQCDCNEIEYFDYQGHDIAWYSFAERGVGLNRNNTLMRATGDIVLFADDDVVYVDGYEKIVLDYYISHPKADVVIFNFHMKRGETSFYDRVTKEGRVTKKRATKYGTYCISAKKDKLQFANIYFHLNFGGGAKYSSGEDTIFLQECISKKLNVYATKLTIGILDHGDSTWFKGYNDKFFFDKGVLYYLLNRKLGGLFAVYHCIKHRKKYKTYGWYNALKQMYRGFKHAKTYRV